MLVSLKNIKEFVNLEGISADEVANALTFAGVEVEEVFTMAQGTNLIIGEILECEKHPDSDHLHVLKVDLGDKFGVEQIVCGAPNARKGLKVIVARVGAKLPDGEIKNGVIRGVASNGMCCSLLELGVDSKYLNDAQKSGIEELDVDAPVGEENVLSYLGLDDTVLNLKVLANRPDLLSIYNVAREIGAIFNREVKIPVANKYNDFKSQVTVGSETNRCSQFAVKEVKNIKVKQSPKWMASYLMSMGIRSINNIVDIGNYVMLMTGQPLHMYDADKLPKAELIARDDYKGDFVALDDKTYSIIPNDVVITSNKEPMCLGGVMGGKTSEVTESTKNVYIESASFDGASIRHTSNRLGLGSESSSRFVKGTNHFQYEEVLNYAASLLKEYCEAESVSETVSYQSEQKKDNKIATSVSKINGRLGTKFSSKQIVDVLERLNIVVVMEDDDKFVATIPEYRLDMTCDADLSEEVIRLLGFENVESILPCLDTKVGALSIPQQRLQTLRFFLLSRGLDECVTYSLISKKEVGKMCLLNKEEGYQILNPLTDEREVFRTHILHSLLKSASYNIARQNKDLSLFETSNMVTKSSNSTNLAIALIGRSFNRGNMKTEEYNFYHMKGILEGFMTELGIDSTRYKLNRASDNLNELHPGKSADIIFQNKVIGRMGELHPNMLKEYDLGKTSCVVLEINLDDILNAKVNINKMNPISKFPYVTRDLAFIINKEVEAKDLLKSIKMIGKGLVEKAEVFDVYEGTNIDPNKKSVAITITYMSDDHTLTEKEVNDAEDAIKFELTKNYGAELRG